MKKTILGRLGSAADLRYLSGAQLEQLCAEIRRFLLDTVSGTGGHLASNLGVVELTVALHRTFSTPVDQIVWDVGHQCYTHKLLTGRLGRMHTLRQKDGLCGFPRPQESEHDAFVAGHASTSISIADGLASAKSLQREPGHVIAVIGDGALTGGMAFEGLNNIARKNNKTIVVLNDNKMSISKNVGGLTWYLSRLRTTGSYYRLKDITKSALRGIPVVGDRVAELAALSLAQIKGLVYNTGFFEEMGFAYMGPVDGHDLTALCEALERAKKVEKPVLLHVETLKGKGYPFAEKNPGAYHGVSQFDPRTGGVELPDENSYSAVFGKCLTRLALDDRRICAVTAAMKYATGLHYFSRRLGKTGRFFDVGIAEGHGVTFSAALASKGLIPVFAVYSTFLQRGYDQLLHDCAIERRHVVLGVDRAGLVGEDGETHQGVFDCAYLSTVPGATIYSPCSYRELELCLEQAVLRDDGLCAVRYPRGAQPRLPEPFAQGSLEPLHDDAGGRELLLVTYGRQTAPVCEAARQLRGKGIAAGVLKLTRVWPIPPQALRVAGEYAAILFVEEGARTGGIAEHFLTALVLTGYGGSVALRALDKAYLPPAAVAEQLCMAGLDADSICRYALSRLEKGPESA